VSKTNIVFACVENSCRSQLAEALAKEFFSRPNIIFFSTGTHPAAVVDPGAVIALKTLGINWQGYPKEFSEIPVPDIIITMGCDVECPVVPTAKTIAWDLKDPKGQGTEAYAKTIAIIREKLEKIAADIS